jgi:L-threonylcarbamoyladenylate synthase
LSPPNLDDANAKSKHDQPMTRVARTGTPEQFAAAVRHAAELLRAGEVVALPTETVYGLAANAQNAQAVQQLFKIKGRPSRNPIIVHVSSLEMARSCAGSWPALADRLAQAFWPGPLTLVLPKAQSIPPIVTAGGSTVGIRWPSHPVALAIINKCGFPLAAPSANPSGRISPTTAEHVRKNLSGRIRLIVDGGPASVGIESTVLDLSVSPPRILRPGMIHTESLLSVTGSLRGPGHQEKVLRSPGLLIKHYSPLARLVIWRWTDENDLRFRISSMGLALKQVHLIAHTLIPAPADFGSVSALPREAAAFARAIYAELHRSDEARPELIVVEALPESLEWSALADRLRRAAT